MAILRYTFIKAPFGAVYLYADTSRIVRIDIRHAFQATALYSDSYPLFDRTKTLIDNYLKGDASYLPFSLPDEMRSFSKAVYSAVRHIPYGKTVTSSDLAEQIGAPTAVRAVEELCKSNPFWIVIPCHRVMTMSVSPVENAVPISVEETLRRLEKRCIDKVRERR